MMHGSMNIKFKKNATCFGQAHHSQAFKICDFKMPEDGVPHQNM